MKKLYSVWMTAILLGTTFCGNAEDGNGDCPVPFEKAANMGFADKRANDGTGGWHDMGPDQDARSFPVNQTEFEKVPFRIVNPEMNNGKSILVFRGDKFPAGLRSAEMVLPKATSVKWLYLLHATSWGNPNDKIIGSIELTDDAGKTVRIGINPETDASDWYLPKEKKNAIIGVMLETVSGNGAVFLSKFRIPEGVSAIRKVRFVKPDETGTIWLVCAATLSEREIPLQQTSEYIIRANAIWRPMEQVKGWPVAGSILDFSGLFPKRSVQELGRIITDKQFRFVYEKTGEVARFHSLTGEPENRLDQMTKKEIDEYVEVMERCGYNLWRCWGSGLFDADPEKERRRIDNFDYMLFKMKERGIYLNLELVNGYDLYFDPEQRAQWYAYTGKLLAHMNPYTKTRLADDPVLAMIGLNNELEFAMVRITSTNYAPLWRNFLKKKYKDNLYVLQNAWGTHGLKSFEDITMFLPLKKAGRYEKDQEEFLRNLEETLSRDEISYIRSLGYAGPLSNFLTNGSYHYTAIREKYYDFVAKNTYHQHPPTWGSNFHISAIGIDVVFLRTCFLARLYGKPFFVTEHGYSFWQKYRYEQGLVTGAYAALNGFSGLTGFTKPLGDPPDKIIKIFMTANDPIARASEFLSSLLFRRGDVKTPELTVRIRTDLEKLAAMSNQASSLDQARMGFLCKTMTDPGKLPMKHGEVQYELTGSGEVDASHGFHTEVVAVGPAQFNMNQAVAELKKKGLVPENNRTDAEKGIFESVTGEILMDRVARTLHVDTARFQGVCGPEGTTAKFKNFEVRSMNRGACVALAAAQGEKTLAEANRMLLVISTNALNSDMEFAHWNQIFLKKGRWPHHLGHPPVLLETGRFDLSVRTPHAEKLHLFAVRADGTRSEEIQLEQTPDGIRVMLDTAKLKHPTVYFELAEK